MLLFVLLPMSKHCRILLVNAFDRSLGVVLEFLSLPSVNAYRMCCVCVLFKSGEESTHHRIVTFYIEYGIAPRLENCVWFLVQNSRVTSYVGSWGIYNVSSVDIFDLTSISATCST